MKWSLDQVKQHPLWRGLTPKEKRFFDLLAELELDEVSAIQRAFDLKPQSVQVRLNQLRGAQDTGFLYRAMMGFALPSREELAAALWQLGNASRDQARKERCIRAASKILGFEKTPASPQASPGSVDLDFD